jgi:hypothetical protein
MNPWLAFKAIVYMENDKIHGGQGIFMQGNGWIKTFLSMSNGRPTNGTIFTEYRSGGQTGGVKSTKERSNISGWISYRGYCDEDGIRCGFGKCFANDGKVYSGTWKKNVLAEGEISELESNGSRNVYSVIFNVDRDIVKGTDYNNQEPTKKTLLRTIRPDENPEYEKGTDALKSTTQAGKSSLDASDILL